MTWSKIGIPAEAGVVARDRARGLFGPMLKLSDLPGRIGTAITYEIGAIG
jgi:hypothetical protein